MKKLIAGVLGALVVSSVLVGCGDTKATTKTTEMKDGGTHKSTEVKEAPK